MAESVIRLDAREGAAAENFERLTRAAEDRLRLEVDGESAPLWNE